MATGPRLDDPAAPFAFEHGIGIPRLLAPGE
jgi:hypothetical protein